MHRFCLVFISDPHLAVEDGGGGGGGEGAGGGGGGGEMPLFPFRHCRSSEKEEEGEEEEEEEKNVYQQTSDYNFITPILFPFHRAKRGAG